MKYLDKCLSKGYSNSPVLLKIESPFIRKMDEKKMHACIQRGQQDLHLTRGTTKNSKNCTWVRKK